MRMRREGSVLGRLDDQRVAHGKCCARHPAEDLQRIVPRQDAGDDAMRLAQRHRRIALEEGNRVAVDLVPGAAVEFVVALCCHHIRLALASRLAGVAQFERRQLVCVAFDQKAEFHQQAAAFDSRHPPPRAIVEGAPRGLHRTVHIARSRSRESRRTPDHRRGRRYRCVGADSESTGLPSINCIKTRTSAIPVKRCAPTANSSFEFCHREALWCHREAMSASHTCDTMALNDD